MIRFGAPWLLGLLLAAPLLWGIFLWGRRQRRRAEADFAGSGLGLLRSGSISPLRRGLKTVLIVTVAALLAVSIARPQSGEHHIILPREGSDVVIALDVSRSMEVSDVKPSRFDHAKRAADALIEHLGGDRVGLVVFAGSANLRFPLTTDFDAAHQVVDGLAIKDGGVKPGTDLVAAINAGRDAFLGDKTRSKVMVLISDGEDLASTDRSAVDQAVADGIVIHTVGVGTADGGAVLAANPRTNQATPVIDPATGKPAVSRRDDGNLRRLAAAGHGTAYDGNTTDFAFDLSGAIDRLQKTRFENGEATIATERFQLPLALALALLLLDSLIPERIGRRRTRAGGRASAHPSAGASAATGRWRA